MNNIKLIINYTEDKDIDDCGIDDTTLIRNKSKMEISNGFQ